MVHYHNSMEKMKLTPGSVILLFFACILGILIVADLKNKPT